MDIKQFICIYCVCVGRDAGTQGYWSQININSIKFTNIINFINLLTYCLRSSILCTPPLPSAHDNIYIGLLACLSPNQFGYTFIHVHVHVHLHTHTAYCLTGVHICPSLNASLYTHTCPPHAWSPGRILRQDAPTPSPTPRIHSRRKVTPRRTYPRLTTCCLTTSGSRWGTGRTYSDGQVIRHVVGRCVCTAMH